MITITLEKPKYVGLELTAEQYFDLKSDGYRYTMFRNHEGKGVLELSPSGSFKHNKTALNIAYKIENYFISTKRSGYVITELDCQFGDVVKRPDVAVYLKPEFDPELDYPNVVPDIAIEVTSKHSKKKDKDEKREIYLEFEVLELWEVHAEQKYFKAFLNQGKKWDEVSITGDTYKTKLLADFALNVPDIFKF